MYNVHYMPIEKLARKYAVYLRYAVWNQDKVDLNLVVQYGITIIMYMYIWKYEIPADFNLAVANVDHQTIQS